MCFSPCLPSAPAWRAWPAVIGGTFQSLSPGEDTRFLLASLVVVIVGGMGSIPGAALGAVIIGLAEQIGLVYAPTYSVVFTFLIMALVLAFRPQGLLGDAALIWPTSCPQQTHQASWC